MQIQQLTAAASLDTLRTRRSGLATTDAQRRLVEFGPNQVEQVRRAPLAARFGREFIHLFAIILWIAAGLAFVADGLQPGQGMGHLGWAIVGVVAINGVFSFAQVYRAERAIESLRRLLPADVNVRRDGRDARIEATQLVPGDIVLIEAGDRIPADCRVIEAADARADLSTITGEARPRTLTPDAASDDDLLQSRNLALAGTSMIQGRAIGVVYATGMRTEFGKIAHLTQAADEPLTPLQTELARLSRVVAALSAIVGIAFFVVGQMVGLSFWQNFVFAIGVIVANVPEGLLPTVTLAMAMAAQRMARHNVLVRELSAVEALGAATVICTDKTGTLTENRMDARQLFVGGQTRKPGEIGQDRDLQQRHRELFETALLCENVRQVEHDGHNTWVGDPMEIALVEMARQAVGDWPGLPRLDEIPFDSDRKRLATLHATPNGHLLAVKGAPEVVLSLCQNVQMDDGVVALTPDLRARCVKAHESMAADGLRVLAVARRAVPPGCPRERLEEDLTLCGIVGLEDPPRPEVPGAIATCRRAGIRVVMITGDHPETAKAIGRQIGLVKSAHPLVITGTDLRKMSESQLQLALDTDDVLFARVGADQKLAIIRALQRKRAIVAATGDGVNDAPALKAANIGIAMGVTGTDVAKDVADLILLDDNFASIVRAIEEGRGIFDNTRKFLTYILTSNIPELVPYLAFVLFGIPLPLTIIQILAVDLGTDIVPALGLGAERPEQEVMLRPPRAPTDRLVDRRLLTRAYLFLGVIEAAASLATFFFMLHRGGWVWGQPLGQTDVLYRQGTTACLTAIVLLQVANVFLCRSDRASTFVMGFLSNPLILVGVAAELSLLFFIDYTPWGHRVFGTAPLPMAIWMFVVPFAVAMLGLEEARKSRVRAAKIARS